MPPCVTTVVGNAVAKSLEPKKLARNASVAMKVSPCRKEFVSDFSDITVGSFVLIFPSCGSFSKLSCLGHPLMRRRVFEARGCNKLASVQD